MSLFPTRATRATRAGRAALVLAAAIVAADCTPPRRPAPPAAPGLPDAPDPAPPIVQRLDARGYRPRAGTLTYEVASATTIGIRGDTLPADTLAVSALVTYRVGPATPADTGAAFRVGGTVDAYEVRSSQPGAALPDTVRLPLHFVGALGAAGIALDGVADAPADAPADTVLAATPVDTIPADSMPSPDSAAVFERPCVAVLSAPVALARELIILPPSSLAIGTTWSDTTVTTLCRGGVPVTTTAVQRFTVLGSTRIDGDEAVAIERASESTVTGATRLRGRDVAVRGTGQGRATFYASVARGAILGADGTYEMELTIESGARRQQFAQATRLRARLRDQY
jgi:hypothetical protein